MLGEGATTADRPDIVAFIVWTTGQDVFAPK